MTIPPIDQLASELVDARRRHHTVEPPSTRAVLSEDQAYEVQARMLALLGADHSQRGVYKISCTSPETQQAVGAAEPAYGVLNAEDVLSNGVEISLGEMFGPLLEVELAFYLRDDLSPQPSRDEILEKCELIPAIEVPDCRYTGWLGTAALSITDLISDNALSGCLILGPDLLAGAVDPREVRMQLRLDDEKVAEGDGRNVLGDPASAVQWLCVKLADQGRQLSSGSLVSAGSLAGGLPVRAGLYAAEFEPGGTVEVTFVP